MGNEIVTAANALYFIQKARVAAQVRLSHLARKKPPEKCELTESIKEKTGLLEEWLNGIVEEYVKKHPAYGWFKKIDGIGNLNIGKVVSLVDIEEASQISKLWRYAGFGCDSDGKAEKRKKGKKLHYNKILKSMCWRLAKAMLRAQGDNRKAKKGPYYEYYQKEKDRIMKRKKEEGYDIVPSSELPKNSEGKHVEKDGKFGLGHVDSMAQRKMMKLFLSHLWVKWREGEGLKVTEPYAHGVLGHSNYLDPDDFIEPYLLRKPK